MKMEVLEKSFRANINSAKAYARGAEIHRDTVCVADNLTQAAYYAGRASILAAQISDEGGSDYRPTVRELMTTITGAAMDAATR